LQKTACFKNALRIAQQLLGSEARCMSDLTILKKEKIEIPHRDPASRRNPSA
jgi:hypothetical protein